MKNRGLKGRLVSMKKACDQLSLGIRGTRCLPTHPPPLASESANSRKKQRDTQSELLIIIIMTRLQKCSAAVLTGDANKTENRCEE